MFHVSPGQPLCRVCTYISQARRPASTAQRANWVLPCLAVDPVNSLVPRFGMDTYRISTYVRRPNPLTLCMILDSISDLSMIFPIQLLLIRFHRLGLPCS